MVGERVWQGQFDPGWVPDQNALFLGLKKFGKYHFVITTMSENLQILEDPWILHSIEEFSEALARLSNSLLICFHSGYDKSVLDEDSHDYMAYQSTHGKYRLSRLVRKVTNSVLVCVKVSWKEHNECLGSFTEIFVDNVEVNGHHSWYWEEQVEGLAGVWQFVMEYLLNVNNVLANMERAGAIISAEKSDRCWNGVTVLEFVCWVVDWWLQTTQVDNMLNWPRFKNCTQCSAFLPFCTIYQI